MKNTLKRSLALLLVLLFAIPTFAFAEDLGVEAVSVEDIALVEDVATDDVVVEQAEEPVEEDNLDLAEANVVIGDEEEAIAEANDIVDVTFMNGKTEFAVLSTTAEGKVNAPAMTSTKTHYTFQGWSDGTTTYKVGDTITTTKPLTLNAVWKGEDVKVTYMYTDANSQEQKFGDAVTVEYGSLLTRPSTTPTVDGRAFSKWVTAKGGSTEVLFSDSTFASDPVKESWTVAEGTNLVPSGTPLALTVWASFTNVFDLTIYEGTTVKFTKNQTHEGDKIDLSSLVKAGKTMALKIGSTSGYAATIDSKNVLTVPACSEQMLKLYLVYTDDTYTVTFAIAGTKIKSLAMTDTSVAWTDPNEESVAYGKYAVAPTVTLDTAYTTTHKLEGWYTTDNYAAGTKFDFKTTAITKDITLYPYIAESVAVTYVLVGSDGKAAATTGVQNWPTNGLVVKGQALEQPAAPTIQNAKFLGWYTGTVGSDSKITLATAAYNFSTPVSEPLTLYASFNYTNITTYTVTLKYLDKSGAEVSPAPIQYIASGDKAVAPKLDEVAGKKFDHWENAVTKQAFSFDTAITADITVQAVYTNESFTVLFNSNGGSAVLAQTVPSGSTLSAFTPPTKDYYTFGGWYKDSTFATPFNVATDKVTENLTLFAKWTGENISVTFSAGTTGATLTGTPTMTLPYGTTLAENGKTAPTATLAGSTFVNWYYVQTAADGKTSNVTFDVTRDTVVNDDLKTKNKALTLVPKFATATYTVKFDTDGGSEVPEQYITAGTTLDKTSVIGTKAPTKAGYTFDGWYNESTLDTLAIAKNATGTMTVTKNITLYAKWVPATPVVSFTSGTSGAVISPAIAPQTLEYGKTATKPDDPKVAGYAFDGWYSDAAMETAFDFSAPVTKDTTVYAKFANAYAVSVYTSTDNTSWTQTDTVYVKANNTTKAVLEGKNTAAGAFVAWYDKVPTDTTAKVFDPATTNITGPIDVYAKYDKDQATVLVTFKPTDNNADDIIVYVVKGQTVTAPEVKKVGHTLSQWRAWNGTNFTDADAFNFSTAINAPLTLKAEWTAAKYTVTFNTDGGSSVAPIGNVDYNSSITLPNAPTKTGYTFNGWYEDAACATTAKAAGSSYAVTKDVTLYAGYNINTFTVTLDLGAGYKMNDKTSTPPDSNVTVKDASKGQYTVSVGYNKTLPDLSSNEPKPVSGTNSAFVGWFTDSALTKAFDVKTPITKDISLYAKFLNSVTVEIGVVNWTYDGAAHASNVTTSVTKAFSTDNVPAAVVEYKKAGADDSTYTPIAPVAAGKYRVRATVAATAKTAPAKAEADLTIAQKEVTIEWGKVVEFTYNGKEQAPTATAVGTIAGETATVTVKGATAVGKHTAEASLPTDGNYMLAASAVKTLDFTIVANTTAPAVEATVNEDSTVTVTVKAADGSVISEKRVAIGQDGATDDFDIKTTQNPDGTVTVTMTAKPTSGFQLSAPITVTGKIALPTATKITALKPGKKKMTVSWDVVTDADGYEIQYGLKKGAAGKMTPKQFTGAITAKATIKKLKKGKRYYFRIRTYKTVNGTTVYSDWSAWKRASKKQKIK